MTKARTGALVLALTVVAIFAAGLGHWRSHLYMYGRPETSAGFAKSASGSSPSVARDTVAPSADRHVEPSVVSAPNPKKQTHTASNVGDQADLGPEPPSAPDPESASAEAAAGAPPHFDVVRVEPSGDTLVAGKARPNSSVELMNGGHVVGKTTSDDSGSFVLLPTPLKPGNYDLSLRAQAAGTNAATSKQSVAVSVPPSKSGQVVVALAEPGQPSKLLSGPTRGAPAREPAQAAKISSTNGAGATKDQTKVAGPAPAQAATPAIQSVEVENRSGVHVSGEGKPGARTEVYLNDAHLASVKPDAGGHWSVTVRKGLTGGHYAVRADTIGSKGKVAARVEVPFDVPKQAIEDERKQATEPASGQTTAQASNGVQQAPDVGTSKTSGQSPGDAIVDAVETALVVRGDNLWDISRSRLGAGQRYTRIYASNVSQIRDPKLIYPGQVFVVPND